MNYSFIKIIPRGNYLTLIDPKDNPRYICVLQIKKMQ